MKRWFKENYRALSAIFLLLLLVGWTTFLDSNGLGAIKIGSGDITPVQTPTSEPVMSPTALPTEEPAPTSRDQMPTSLIKILDPTSSPMPENPTSAEDAVTPTAVPTPAEQPTTAPEPTATPVPTSTPEPTATPAPTATPVPAAGMKFKYVIANVQEKLNVRSGPGESYPIVAKLKANGYGRILERGTTWTKIKSGDYTGYVKNEYLLFDNDALERLRSTDSLFIKVTAGTMNIRKGPGTDTEVLGKAAQGDRFGFIPEKSTDEWICIVYNGGEAYASEELVDAAFNGGTAVEP